MKVCVYKLSLHYLAQEQPLKLANVDKYALPLQATYPRR